MLIGIDGRPFYGPRAGTGRYVSELCRALDAALPEARFLVYGNRPLNLPVSNARWRQRIDDYRQAARMPAALWYLIRAGSLARRDKVDVFWGGANFLPVCLGQEMRAIVTVHDVVYQLFPQTLNLSHKLAYRLFFKHGLRRAQLIVANSIGTATRLLDLYGRSSGLIVRPRAAADFKIPSRQAILGAQDHFGIDFPYFLSVSTLEPRKNLGTLIEAFLQMHSAGELHNVGLVLVGQAGWKDRRLADEVARARTNGARIVVTGYVADEWLPALYAGARAVVMPSLYEGFGMPVLEAKSCGARVVASDIPEIREAGGEGPIYVDPTVEGIKEGLRQAERSASCPSVDFQPGAADLGTTWAEEAEKFADAIRALA